MVLDDARLERIVLQQSEIDAYQFLSRDAVLASNEGFAWSIPHWAHHRPGGYVETQIIDSDDKRQEALRNSWDLARRKNKRRRKMGILVISRHGESEWNLLGKWTGWTDVGLTEKGRADTVRLGALLKDIKLDEAYTSALKRTHQTLKALLEGRGKGSLPTTQTAELNERDYGDLTGKNKWEVKAEIGEEAFNGIRRGWDYPVPGGETLKDVYARVVPYFEREILPKLQAGENILLVAHGNSIRALMKHLDHVPEADMAHVEMPFGQLLVYTFEPTSDLPTNKDVLSVEIEAVNA